MALPIPGVNGVSLTAPPLDVQGLLANKKAKAMKGMLGGISNSGGGILDPNATVERERAWLGSTAMQNAAAAPPSPYDSLQQQLFNAVNSNTVPATPLDTLRQMAQSQVAAQFDPMISALKGEMANHTTRGNESAGKAREMYGALAKDYLSQLPAVTQQFAAEDQSTNQRYDQSQAQMADQYQKQAADQDAIMKRLGVQAAAPDATQQTKEDQAYFQNQSEMDQQNALSALDQQQMAQQDYQRNSGNNAKMAGENTAEGIMQQLSDYLSQAGDQMGNLQGQKQAAVSALLSQLQGQDQQRIQQEQQQNFQNMMSLYNFQLSAQKAADSSANNAGGAFGSGGANLTSGLPGAQNYLASVYPNQPTLVSSLMGLLDNVISKPDVKNGKYVLSPGDALHGPKYSDVGQQYMEGLLRQQFAGQPSGRYTPQDINATLAALEAYLGKLR